LIKFEPENEIFQSMPFIVNLKFQEMKKFLFVILILSNAVFAIGKEIEAPSKIVKATVFLNGAQVTRESSLTLSAGKTTLKFSGLSPYIDKNSIKVSGAGRFTILSVNYSINYLQNTTQSAEFSELSNKIEQLTKDTEYKKTELSVLKDKKDFLVTNKKIISNEKSISPTDFKLFKEIYYTDLESLEISILKKQREINELNKKITSLKKQVQEAKAKKDLPTSEITVIVSSKSETKGKIILSYYVSNAGWYPSYDIRVDDISSPVRLFYKANVHQNTGIDWKNVKLTFSNATPAESASIPFLYPYYLDFNNYTIQNMGYSSRYVPGIRLNEVSGVVKDIETGDPVAYATVVVKGTSIGTTTDKDGKFSLSLPAGAKTLQINFVGYKTAEVPVTGNFLNISLSPSAELLEEVMVIDHKIPRKPLISRKRKEEAKEKTIPVDVNVYEHKTNFEFNIKTPYTLNSNSNNLTIEMKEIELNSSYIYKSVPKITPQAFLIANVVDWEQYSLLDGEVNLYYENTYVGKSVLDLKQLSDTLEISLGPDKNISIKRTKEKEHTGKQFIGGNVIESRTWKTTIRNNKSEKIKLIVLDQVPVSNNQEITVDVKELSNGKLDQETGEVTWEIELAPKETVEKMISYTVKFPKKKDLVVE